jgi:hypothetical protein
MRGRRRSRIRKRASRRSRCGTRKYWRLAVDDEKDMRFGTEGAYGDVDNEGKEGDDDDDEMRREAG